MVYYAGLDLHSNNTCLGIIDDQENRVIRQRMPNDLPHILKTIEPFKEKLGGVVVESTFNWYWLVDGLIEHGYRVHLANPSAMKQYSGLKYSDDFSDAYFLAQLLRLGILPTGYIYPKEQRAVRDLLRKRSQLVQQRTIHILSFQALAYRNLGYKLSSNAIKKITVDDVETLFDNSHRALAGQANIATMRFLAQQIRILEKAIKEAIKLSKDFGVLLTTPGIGDIIAMTIMLEAGNMNRFATVGNYVSYCRCVGSKRTSNDKKKGSGNKKNGNKYLSWAYVEAANFAMRYEPIIKRYYQRKVAKTNTLVAIKAVAHKLARANYCMVRDQQPFNILKAFA